MTRILGIPVTFSCAVHVPDRWATIAWESISIAYRFGGHQPKISVNERGMVRLIGLWNPMARSAYEMAGT